MYRINSQETNIGFYSFVYRKNNSAYTSTEKLILQLSGMQFVGEVDEDFVSIESGKDHIIVMRCDEAFGGTSYGMSMAWKSRPMSDAELVDKCKE